MRSIDQLVAGTALTLFAGVASATVIIDNSTTGWYNQGLGDLADTYGPGSSSFPGANVSEGDPNVNPLPEPDLSSTPALGNWLSGDFTLGSWTGPNTTIPDTWTVNDETAIVYEFILDQAANVTVNIGVDNGVYAWFDGVYTFGAMAPGGSTPGEYSFGTSLSAGTHYLQLLREDHGGRTGFDIEVSAVPEPATLGLLGLGLLGMGLTRRKR